jgi:hypothetical protein
VAITITPNLQLKVDSTLSADAKYNLSRIDTLAGKVSVAINGDTKLRSSTNIVIEADSAEVSGGTGRGVGTLSLGTPSNKLSVLTINATGINFGDATVYNFKLNSDKLLIGNSSNRAVELNTAVTGDILATEAAALTIKNNVIKNNMVATDAAIDQSKISGLVSDLAGKEPTVAKGNLSTLTSGVTITGGTNAVIGTGTTVNIATASPSTPGLLAPVDYVRFDAIAPAAVSDIITNTSGVTISNGSNSILGISDVVIDIATATDSQSGLLSASDHASYSGHIANNSNPHNVTKSQVGLSDVTNDAQLPLSGGTLTGQLVLDNQGIVFNITDDYVGTPAEGTVWWNKDDHTLNVQSDIVGTINQVGQENWLRARNDTGSPIPEGAAVYISGANTARPTVVLAVASAPIADRVLGIATVTITSGQLGVITTFGLVRHLATNVDGDGVALADGDPIYLSATTPGEWVKAKPHAPNHCISLGQIVNAASGAAGNIFVNVSTGTHLQDLHDVNIETALTNDNILRYNSSTQIWENSADLTNLESKLSTANADSNELTGFVDPANIIVTYDSTARTIMLSRLDAGAIEYYNEGDKYSLASGWISDPHDSTLNAKYFLFLHANGVGTWYNVFPGFDNGAYVAQINYFAAYKFAIRECHGLMAWQTWEHLHRNVGTYRLSGGAVTGGTYSLLSDTVAAVTPGLDSMVVVDEDLPSTIAALSNGGLYTLMYINAGEPIFTLGSSLPYPVSGANNLQYNAGGNGLTEITTNDRYINIYAIAIPTASDNGSQSYRYVWITGQNLYTSTAAAAAEDIRSFTFGTTFASIVPESYIYVRFTLRYRGSYSTTTGKSRLETGPDYLVGNRLNQISVTGVTPPAAPALRYAGDFTTGSWSGVAPSLTFSVAGATHGKGSDPVVIVRQNTTGDIYEDVGVDVSVDRVTGNVTLTSSEAFNGEVIIL